jgi:hypothetical protein
VLSTAPQNPPRGKHQAIQLSLKEKLCVSDSIVIMPTEDVKLCFFIVDDDDAGSDWENYTGFSYHGMSNFTVLTTADVPLQECVCNVPTLHFLLSVGSERLTGRYLPPELSAHIIGMVDIGVTREVSEQRRRAFMYDRKVVGDTGDETHVCEVSTSPRYRIGS